MTAPHDDTAPQQRLISEDTLKFMNFNRRLPMLSSKKDVNGELHLLLFGEENTILLDLTADFDIEAVQEKIQLTQNDNETGFNIKSLANKVMLVQLPEKLSPELITVLFNVNYKVPTIFIPTRIVTTAKIQTRMVILPESVMLVDLTVPRHLNWDALCRLITMLDKHDGWCNLHKSTSIGMFSIPDPHSSNLVISHP